MKVQKKETHQSPNKRISLKKISLIFYTIFTIKSILMHNINTLSNLLIELLVYSCIGFGIYIATKNISITQFKEDFKLLFEND